MKSPEDIKKGLECCINWETGCTECPYDNLPHDECVAAMKSDTLAYTQQLESRINALIPEAVLFEEAIAAGEKYKRERDAAIRDIQHVCTRCIHGEHRFLADGKLDDRCGTCVYNGMCNWEWRGVPEVE